MTVQDWKNFLAQQGARFDTSDPQCWAHFEDKTAPEGSLTLTPLTQYSLVEVVGMDAQKFLQGQLTCDVNQLQPGDWQSGAVCNPQGRVYGNFELGLTKDDIPCYLMRLPLDVIDSLTRQLGKYIVFYKSRLGFNPGQWAGFELRGDNTAQILADALSVSPDQLTGYSSLQRGVLKPLAEASGYECWLPFNEQDALWKKLGTDIRLGDSQWYSLARIRQGVPDIQQATAELFTPEAINLTHTGAVSFKKGCYTGQEIVARMHYRGTAKTGLVHLRLDTNISLLPGTELESQTDQQKLTLVNCAPNEQQGTEVLAVAPTRLYSEKELTLLADKLSVKAELKAFNTINDEG